QESDQKVLFLNAWLPEDHDHVVECLASIGHPVYGNLRLAVRRQDDNYPHSPYLFVMTKAVEDILIHKNLEIVEIHTEPGTNDAKDSHITDNADTSVSIQRF